MKKLVRIDPNTGRIIDIDQEKLKRIAKELLDYLNLDLDPQYDTHGVKAAFSSLCNDAINGKIKEAIPPDDLPLEYQRRERIFDEKLNKLLARFCVTVSGTPLEQITTQDIDGVPHAYIEVE
ncbi:hypothetical protein [Microbulbifer taiwanensis]|uniref:Uncharacterized protein n=1 Tax=Microbulbifer taiwanensis TaxID=986746 RepID=A0ABW1YMB0_9GAMM|nr:hypothetical protein [Microbulbifer taiwanensis]